MPSATSNSQNTKGSSQIPGQAPVPVGGGAINEKERHYGKQDDNDPKTSETGKTLFDPQNIPAHLLHALCGVERYPNYLSRWNYDLGDVDRLEQALEEQLAMVRQQKQRVVERNALIQNIQEKVMRKSGISLALEHEHDDDDDDDLEEDSNDWKDVFQAPTTWEEIRDEVLDARASKAIFGSKQFRNRSSSSSLYPSVQDVLNGKVKIELDPALLGDWLDEEFFDVYSFPLLSKSFCIKLKKALQAIILQSRTEETKLDDFGKRPIDLDSIGVSWINNLLFHLVIRPISRQLFGATEGIDDLDWRQGYIAGYSHQPSENKGAQRHRLVPHTDDSEVTLNVGKWGLKQANNIVIELHVCVGGLGIISNYLLHSFNDSSPISMHPFRTLHVEYDRYGR